MTAAWNAVIYFPNMQFVVLIMTKQYDKALKHAEQCVRQKSHQLRLLPAASSTQRKVDEISQVRPSEHVEVIL